MLKFVKHHLENITDVAIYPMISLLIFFVFFVVLFWWVLTAKKDYIKKVRNIPFEDDNQTTSQNDYDKNFITRRNDHLQVPCDQ